MEPERHAVVLAGGGAHGAYAVGVLEALLNGRWQKGRRGEVRPSIFTGTSVGAYSASILAQHGLPCGLESVRYLRELWLERIASVPGARGNGVYHTRGFPPRALLKNRSSRPTRIPLAEKLWNDARATAWIWLRRLLSLGFSGETPLRRLVRTADLGDLLSTAPMERLIAETIDARALQHPRAGTLKIATTHWDLGRTVIFCNRPEEISKQSPLTNFEQRMLDEQNTNLVIRASASVPGLFPPVRLYGENFVDGGLLLNAPLYPALNTGANRIHVIHFEHQLASVPVGRAPSLFETTERMVATIPSDLLRWDCELARRNNQLFDVAHSADRLLRSHGSIKGDDQHTLRRFVETFRNKPRAQIHRHHPHHKLGGAMGLLDFRRSRIIELMERGFEDAIHHDCEANGCIL